MPPKLGYVPNCVSCSIKRNTAHNHWCNQNPFLLLSQLFINKRTKGFLTIKINRKRGWGQGAWQKWEFWRPNVDSLLLKGKIPSSLKNKKLVKYKSGYNTGLNMWLPTKTLKGLGREHTQTHEIQDRHPKNNMLLRNTSVRYSGAGVYTICRVGQD